MPDIRYTMAVVQRLAQDLSTWFDPPPDASENERIASKNRYFLMEWALKEHVPEEELSRMAKRSMLFSHALKKAKLLCQLRLAHLMIDEPKRCIPIIFTLKNLAGWRDDPLSGKGLSSNKLTLNLVLPSKIPLSFPAKSRAVKALAVEIDGRLGANVGQRKQLDNVSRVGLKPKPVRADRARAKAMLSQDIVEAKIVKPMAVRSKSTKKQGIGTRGIGPAGSQAHKPALVKADSDSRYKEGGVVERVTTAHDGQGHEATEIESSFLLEKTSDIIGSSDSLSDLLLE
jgi:hypothetical protein